MFPHWGVLMAVVFFINSIQGQKLKDSIYSDIEEIRPCFRRLNGTAEIGCTSNIGGNVGVVMYVKDLADVDKVTDDAFAPYIVFVDPFIFSGELLDKLKSSGNVNGVILPSVTGGLWQGHYPKSGYSDDSTCPNNDSKCSTSSPWNPSGSNTMWVDWGFPIFLVQETNTTEKLYNCFLEYNDKSLSWPLCSMELKANMYGAVDSQTCIRRSNLFNITPLTVCDPLSDNNIHYFVSPRNGTSPANQTKTQSEESVIIVSARMDALSIFDQVEVGFDTPATGIVTLLTTAHLVAKAMRTISYKAEVENILFLLIHGESFDYIGSSRLVYDMENQAFPFNKSKSEAAQTFYRNGTQPLFTKTNIKSFLELGQLSNSHGSDDIFMHSANKPKEMVDTLRSNSGSLSTTAVNGIPPASAQSFLKHSDIPSVVLTNFERDFSNNMYHSIYDSADFHQYQYELGKDQKVVKHIAKVSMMVAKTIITLATGQAAPKMEDQATLVNELLNCYTITANCTLFHEASEPGNYPWIFAPESRRKTPFPQYVGVRSSYHTLMTKLVLQYLTGTPEPLDTDNEDTPDIAEAKKTCLAKNAGQNIYRYVYLVGKSCYNTTGVECGTCYQTTVDTTEAASPAFLPGVIQDYDWSSGLYPTWTESIWKVISGRLFLQGSPAHDHGIFAMGIIILVVSLAIVFWLDKNSAIIFTKQKTVEVDNPLPVEM